MKTVTPKPLNILLKKIDFVTYPVKNYTSFKGQLKPSFTKK